MKFFFLVTCCLLSLASSFAQAINLKLQKAFQRFENDSQLKHALISLYVIDAATGKVVFDKNSMIGLAPASTQKIITAVTAYELLGKDFRYKTELSFLKDLHLGIERYSVTGSGDPTFGSDRYSSTIDTVIFEQFFTAFKTKATLKNRINILTIDKSINDIPDGWVWQDLGNYYGAPSSNLNWKENQYDLFFRSEKPGRPVEIIDVQPKIQNFGFNNKVVSGSEGTGDNAYIYFTPGLDTLLVKGSIPPYKKRFSISGSMPDPVNVFINELASYFSDIKRHSPVEISKIVEKSDFGKGSDQFKGLDGTESKTIYSHYSPTLDSIIYWFLRKSINLYGEALIKTFNSYKTGLGSRDTGIVNLRNFWKQKGLEPGELNIYDGSGLSPFNRVTTHAQVEVLKYAKKQNWFKYFYEALPEYNAMKMKSGTINDVKAFCGYHTAKDGKEYIFSFIVNNYNGLPASLVNKMYTVLDILK